MGITQMAIMPLLPILWSCENLDSRRACIPQLHHHCNLNRSSVARNADVHFHRHPLITTQRSLHYRSLHILSKTTFYFTNDQ